jgi:pimeloyl-ACP methyl ester carboxylesterase
MRRVAALTALLALAAPLGVAVAAPPSAPFVERSFETRDGVTMRYLLVRPAPIDASAEVSVLVALPPGNQTREMAEWGLRTYWAAEAQARGWVVVSPIRPTASLLFNGTEGHFADLVDHLAKELEIRGGKVHLAGMSNGGLSAFHAAVTHPGRVRALVVLPGFPPSEDDYERLAALRDVPVTMLVGERDSDWLPEMERAEKALSEAGGKVSLRVMPGESHVLRSLGDGKTLYDILAAAP